MLKDIFQSEFNSDKFSEFLKQKIFDNADKIELGEGEIDSSEMPQGYSGKILNDYYINNNKERIGLFVYQCPKNIIRTRVEFIKILEKFTKLKYDGILAVFISKNENKDSIESKNKLWRLSFICDKANPKRYTFLLGKENKTAQKRFEILAAKERITIKDIKEAFAVEPLTKEFYNDISKWYKFACECEEIKFLDCQTDSIESKNNKKEHILRLITRLVFCWFIKQKNLIQSELFEPELLQNLLENFNENNTDSIYYNAILQNLFFATINCEIKNRKWLDNSKNFQGKNNSYNINNIWRDDSKKSYFKDKNKIENIFNKTPFLNGGLFECLDDKDKNIYKDGFSCKENRRAFVPNYLFFADSDKNKNIKQDGIITILKRYNFTINENDENDKEVALDPELLGHIFENLLGEVNEETQNLARKDSGSFYTPKNIVDFMVKSSLYEYLCTIFEKQKDSIKELVFENKTDNITNKDEILKILQEIKIFDPACGSGAFPMGFLSLLLNLRIILDEKDEKNEEKNEYNIMLEIIQNNIFGVDKEPIAQYIARLRFFIALILHANPSEQDMQNKEKNYGYEALPNIETKFLCADTLKKIDNTQKELLKIIANNKEFEKLEKDLKDNRSKFFKVKTYAKKQELKTKEKEIKNQMEEILNNTLKNIENKKENINNKHKSTDPILLNPAETKEVFEKYEKDSENIKAKINDIFAWDPFAPASKDNVAKFFDCEIMFNLEQKEKEIEFTIQQETKQKEILISPSNKKLEIIDKQVNLFGDTSDEIKIIKKKEKARIKGYFDIIIGNPPYIQLQNNSGNLAKEYKNCGFESYTKMGDIYCLFYEKAYELLSPFGVCCFITSNKWLKASYGAALRGFLSQKYNPKNTKPINPQILIDFCGNKIFESATVDTNILLFSKQENKQNTNVISFKNKVENLLDSVYKNEQKISFYNTEESWIILSDIESKIKAKIEKIGVPLKEWDINIYRGILTGFNEAFIINKDKRDEILNNCKDKKEKERTEKILRPILRGKDIKRYGYNFADLYLISTFPSMKYDIEQYPSVKNYLLTFGKERLEQSGKEYVINGEKIKARKKTNNKWFEVQDSIAYWQEFDKPKIVWNRIASEKLFALVESGIYIQDSMHFFTEKYPEKSKGNNLKILNIFLNSKLYVFLMNLIVGGAAGGNAGNSDNVKNLCVLKLAEHKVKNIILLFEKKNYKEIDNIIYELYKLNKDEIKYIESNF